jgi:hypothetical protein
MVAAACQRLRSFTVFDDSTGCVNDRVPAIVPLLPPEEVWCDGRELPLDVWRILSFDIDLVSSALSAHVPLDDIAFGSLTQAGLAFRAMMSRIQAVVVELAVSGQNLPAAFPTGLTSSPTRLSIPLARVFFEAGTLLTPLRQSDITQWYAALRYVEWIANTPPRLCVRDEYRRESVDSRYRGLFAEEIAIGIMATILGDLFHAKPIVNTVELLAATAPTSIRRNELIADFVAKARHPSSGQEWTIIAESKGSLGKGVSNGRVTRAKQQVSATKARFPRSRTELPLAFCSSVFFATQKKDASCIVIDPPADIGEDDLLVDPTNAWRFAYAKAFRFVGLDSVSNQVISGEPVTLLHRMSDVSNLPVDEREQGGRRRRRVAMARERFSADLLLDVGPCAVGIDPSVFNLLRETGIRQGVTEDLDRLAERRDHERGRWHGRSFMNYLGLGCIFYDDLE